ncbi:oligosaccharyltransferase complex subunit OSTC [Pelomyxa schiedti]|nr:oligosaccharyltransferase complex subunit OSTC [Pelomyxa schiedti]
MKSLLYLSDEIPRKVKNEDLTFMRNLCRTLNMAVILAGINSRAVSLPKSGSSRTNLTQPCMWCHLFTRVLLQLRSLCKPRGCHSTVRFFSDARPLTHNLAVLLSTVLSHAEEGEEDGEPMQISYHQILPLAEAEQRRGIIYDIIVEPPSVGSGADGRPIAFLQYRINGQFIIEGLSAGMLFALGGAGLIILDKSTDKYLSQRNRYLMFLSGAICVVAAYALSLVFIHMKVPGYMD